MGISKEMLRQIRAIEKAGNKDGARILRGHLGAIQAAEQAGAFKQLPPEEVTVREAKRSRRTPEEPLQRLIPEYKSNPNDPDVNTRIWRAFLPEAKIPACDWTEEQIAEPIKGVNGEQYEGLMVPAVRRYTEEEGRGLVRLGDRFAGMGSYSVQEGTPVRSDIRPGIVWVKIEATIDAPNRDTTEAQLSEHFKSQGRYGIREEVYILGGQFSKRVSGRYFDEGGTRSRLLGSRGGGDVIHARLSAYGKLDVDWPLSPRGRDPRLGGRSEGVLQ